MNARRALEVLVLLSCTAPTAAAPPELGALGFLPGDAAVGPAWGDQAAPAIAKGSASHLVVWSDARAHEGKWDIYGIRLDSDGVPIDPVAFAIDEAHGSQTKPLAAWNGTHWLVTWLDEGDLVATRVSSDGSVLGATIDIASPGASASVALASDGTGWAVVWAGTAGGNAAVRGARIASDGRVLDPGGVVILPETYFIRANLALAFSTDRYLLVWPEWTSAKLDDVLGHRLSRTLQKMESSPLTLGSTVNYDGPPAVAGNGSEFYLVWKERDTNGWVNGIAGTRVSLAGVAATPGGTAIGDRRSWGDAPDVAWDGSQWVAAWTADGVWAARVTSGGTVRDPAGIRIGGATAFDMRDAAVAASFTGGARVIWQDYRNHRENDIWGGGVTSGGSPATERAVSLSLPSQQSPRVVWNGNGYAVAYLSESSDRGRILVQRLDASGAAVDPEPVEVASGNVHAPGIAWSGNRYLVTWRDRNGSLLRARRLSATLALQDAGPIEVMAGENPAVAALGDVFLVSGEYASYYPNRAVYVQRVDGVTGAKLGDRRMVPGGFPWATTLGTVGNRWLVSFESHQSPNDSIYTLAYGFIGADGVPETTYGLVMGSGWGNSGVRIASHPETGAIVYSTTRAPSASNGEIYLLRVRADGGMPDGFTGILLTANAPAEQYAPGAAWSGVEFTTVFQDTRNEPGLFFFPKSDLYGVRVDANGGVLDAGGGFPVETTSAPEREPDVAGSDGDSLVVASHLRGGGVGALRIGVRRLIGAGGTLGSVSGLAFSTPTSMQWEATRAAVVYDVLRGDLAALRGNGSIGDASCVDDDLPNSTRVETAVPAPGQGFYYVIRADGAGMAPGTYDDPEGAGLLHTRDDDVGTEGGNGCGDVP